MPTGWRARLEGWQAIVVAVSVAGVAMLVGTPRAVPPEEVPLPVPSPAGLAAIRATDDARAATLARTSERDREAMFELRALGDLMRQYGQADLEGRRDDRASLRPKIVEMVRHFEEIGQSELLLSLRAYQMRVFQHGLSTWEATGKEDEDTRAVGGDFVALAEDNGWLDGPHAFSMDDDVRGALFKRRWAEITAVNDLRFSLSIDEMRALYAFWLRNPPRAATSHPDPPERTLSWLMAKVNEIAAVDREYPGELAKGVLAFQLGDHHTAANDFRAHLSLHPDGPWTLRARNYLVAALVDPTP